MGIGGELRKRFHLYDGQGNRKFNPITDLLEGFFCTFFFIFPILFFFFFFFWLIIPGNWYN